MNSDRQQRFIPSCLICLFFLIIKAVPKAPLSQWFLPDVITRHEGLIKIRSGQLGQPRSISTTEAETVIIKKSKSSQACTTQNSEKTWTGKLLVSAI